MEENAITPSMVNEIMSIPAEDIAKISEEVIEATKVTNKASEELVHLSSCLSDFANTHETYQERASHVRNQMRNIASRL